MSLTVVFDDGWALGPLTDLRAVFNLRTGIMTTRERWEGALGRPFDGVWTPDRLRPVVQETMPACSVCPDLSHQDDVLLVNGACVIPCGARSIAMGEWLRDEAGRFIVGRLTGADAQRVVATGEPPAGEAASVVDDQPVIARVSDIIRLRDRAIDLDLHHLAPSSRGEVPSNAHTIEGAPIVLDEGCCVGPSVVLDASGGAIYIASGATIRPRATLIGPCAVLERATVLDGAVVRPNTVIGPVSKANGEIGGTIIQGYSNKAHDGYVGDAYIGEWVNLGAGTNNSNLLNTYGVVKAPDHLGADRTPTGLTFFGGVIGDHVKAAIGTRLPTGCVVGTGAMLATSGALPNHIERFAWITDAGSQRYRWDRFESVMRAVMSRRSVEPGRAYGALVRSLAESQA